MDHLCFYHAFASVHCCLVVTYWERQTFWLLLVMFGDSIAIILMGKRELVALLILSF